MAVPANIAGGFVLGPIMFLGMLSVFVGFVSPDLSVPLNVVAGLFTGFLLTVAAWFGHPSFAVYRWQGLSLGFLVAAFFGAALVAAACLAHHAGVPLRRYAGGRRQRHRFVVVAFVALGWRWQWRRRARRRPPGRPSRC